MKVTRSTVPTAIAGNCCGGWPAIRDLVAMGIVPDVVARLLIYDWCIPVPRC